MSQLEWSPLLTAGVSLFLAERGKGLQPLKPGSRHGGKVGIENISAQILLVILKTLYVLKA